MIKTGIIGCGNIGREIAEFLLGQKNFEVTTLTDINKAQARSVQDLFKDHPPAITTIEEAIRKNSLLIEAANKNVVSEILVNKFLDEKGKKLMVMSTGGLVENAETIKKFNHLEIILPSGAIAGLDAIKAVAGKINSLTLTTTKPVDSFSGTTFVKEHHIDLSKILTRKIIFEGGLAEAIHGFPQNINVAATLFLASQFENIKIQVVADPAMVNNKHEIVCKGSFGTISTTCENLPSKNKKTSYLAILSALSTLKNLDPDQ